MGNLGPTEIVLVMVTLVMLFGAKKLPELARGSGRALRIFKAETKGLLADDETATREPDQGGAIENLRPMTDELSPHEAHGGERLRRHDRG